MFVFLGFVTIWVELPSSAPILWFDVLSLVNWVAGLPSASDVLSEYLQSAWGSHFVGVLLFSGLNSFLTYSCAGELQLPGCTAKCFQCTVRVPSIFFWTELFLDLLLCRRVTVASCTAKCFQCTVRVLSIFLG